MDILFATNCTKGKDQKYVLMLSKEPEDEVCDATKLIVVPQLVPKNSAELLLNN